MASSSPSSDPSDAEDFNCENKSTLKLPGDCLPCEELPSLEEIILLEDATPPECSSGDLICPDQGRWKPEGEKRWPNLQQLLRDDPQQIYKRGISVAWADKKSTTHDEEIQKGENKNHQKIQRKKKHEDFNVLNLTMVKGKSTLKLPGDCLPCEELPSLEEIILLEDAAPRECSSGDLICPDQGRWKPEGKKRWPNLQQLLRDDPQQIYKRGISVAWADKKSTTHDEEIQKGENKNHQKIQRKKKHEDFDVLNLTTVEGLRPSSCLPAQLTQQEHEVQPDSPTCKPSGNTDVGPFPELPATPKGQERAEVSRAASQTARARPDGEQRAGEASSSHKSGTTAPSTSSPHLGDEAARPPSTASQLVRRAFCWLNQRVLSMGRRRRGPDQATRSCPQQAPHRWRCLRGKRIQPDGPPGQLGPRMPTFSRYVLPHYEKFEKD